MAAIISAHDLPAVIQQHELVDALVEGVNAKASRVAPCLADSPTDEQVAEARLVLIGAVKRWTEAGSGALQSQTAGPFSQTLDTRQRTGFNLWPSEIEALQSICATGGESKAFSLDAAPPLGYSESSLWWGYETPDGTRTYYP